MRDIEVEGKTTEDAIEAACRQLGQPREMLEIEIITPGSTGIFGLVGARKAKVRARIKQAQAVPSPPQPEERRPRGRRRQRPRKAQAAAEPAEPAPAPAEEPEAAGPSAAAAEVPELAQPSPELLDAARQACQHIVVGLGYEGLEVQATALPGEARLELVGEDSSALIGRRGDVLNALQHLVSKIANRQTASRMPVTIDAEGWRARRRQALEELAQKLARKAKESGKPVAMSPMNAHDRRLVHLALQHDGELRTKSRGEGALRKVVIFPRRRRRNAKKAQGSGSRES